MWCPPIDQQTYEAISDKVMQAGADKGMRFHAAGEAGGRWRIFEVWDSRDGLEAFIREDLASAADEVSGGEARIPQPEVIFDIDFHWP